MRKSSTTPQAIERQTRLAEIMAQRLQGCTFREIGALQGVSTSRAHVLFWRAMRACKFDPARLRRRARLERAMQSDSSGDLV
jgi:DNA-directed RNA polymerase specialized sigma24 family protein